MNPNQTGETPLTVQTERGVSVLWQGRHLYSRFAPEGSAVKTAARCPITPMTLYLLPSPLLCYGVSDLINRMDSESTLLLIEREKGLSEMSASGVKRLLKTTEAAEKLRQEGRIFSIQTDQSVDEIFTGLIKKLPPFRRVCELKLSGGSVFQSDFYSGLTHRLARHAAQYWKNRSTISHLAGLWYRNIFNNVASIKGSIPLDSINTRKLPCAVAAAGETLESGIPELKKNRNNLFLIAADTALPALLRSGITPDCCVVLEGQHHNVNDFIGFGNRLSEIHLAADISCDPAVLRLFKSYSLFGTRFSTGTLLKRLFADFPSLYQIPQLGSVGIAALFLASMLNGEQPLFCTGLDFAARRGKSHARGTFFHNRLLSGSCRTAPQERGYYSVTGEKWLTGGEEAEQPPFFTHPVMEGYLQSAMEVAAYHPAGLSGPALLTKLFKNSHAVVNEVEMKRFRDEYRLIDSKPVEPAQIKIWIQNELRIVSKLLKSREGLEPLVKNGGEADYLRETFISKSSEKVGNEQAGILKINAYRLQRTLNRALCRLTQSD